VARTQNTIRMHYHGIKIDPRLRPHYNSAKLERVLVTGLTAKYNISIPVIALPVSLGFGITSLRGLAPLDDLIQSVKASGLEGLVAKRRDGIYEPGLRSGAWQKMRVNRGQEFVIGGFTVGGNSFDALIFGCYQGDRLIYVARTRNGFTPSSRLELAKRCKDLETTACPFANPPEAGDGVQV
jgi:hypothetical protein